MMNRRAALEILKKQIKDEICVAAYSTAHDWLDMNDRDLNYFSFGAMGLGSSHGLGLALGQPNRKVVVLDGVDRGTGTGVSKKQAEQAAARVAAEWLRAQPEPGAGAP
mgnify:CR=1 FL=1